MTSTTQYIGKPFKNVDAEDKLTGATKYITDMRFDNMAWAYPIFSTVPFGAVRQIDLKAARSVPGYIDVILAERIPGENQVGVIVEDQPLLAGKTVRFIGDVIGIAVAETAAAAHRIAKLVEITYTEYEPYFSIAESESATSQFIHETNIACSHRILKGDPAAAFRKSDLIVEAEFSTGSQEHFYLEPQGCVAFPEKDGQIVVMGSLQCPYYVQKAVARALGRPLDGVRVIQAPTGGAFGGKEDVPSELGARVALAASLINRPVKMIYKRSDDIQITSKRHAFSMRYKVGVMRDGTLQAAEITLQSNAGAYATLSSVVSYRSTMQSMGPYVVPNIRVNSTAYYTNLPPAGAFRGFGSPQVAFGHERMMDLIADRLDMDPVRLRLKNVLKVDAKTITGQQLSASVGAEETIRQACRISSWETNQATGSTDGRYRYGQGIAASIYGNCLGAAGWHMDGAGVNISIQRDGTVKVAFGLAEMGQGALTVVAQMTAEALGIDHRRVVVLLTDTNSVPDSGPSVASRNVVMTGNAIRDAASKLLPILKAAAAELLGCGADDVTIGSDLATDSKTGTEVGFAELADYLYRGNQPTEMRGWWHVPQLDFDPDTGQGEAYFTYSYATHVARVQVDTLTGQVQVRGVWAAHDAGTVINPAGLEGQVEGGVAQATGWALTENILVDRGQIITSNLSTYLLPTALDAPPVETVAVEDPDPRGPWGAKGVGEPAFIPAAPAIANAISNALGVEVYELPLTPPKVLQLLEEQEPTAGMP